LEPAQHPNDFIRHPTRINYSRLGTLKHKIAPGTPPLDIQKFRDQRCAPLVP
jgi:hypothetical protein